MQKDLCISEMKSMQYELWELNKEKWSPMEPEFAKNFILYMIEEIGEVIAIVKKKSIDDIMNDKVVRGNLVEELADVLMYYNEVLNRFNISAEDLATAYVMKHNKNVKRNYEKDYTEFLASNE